MGKRLSREQKSARLPQLRADYSATSDVTERQRIHDEIETALSSRRELSDEVKVEDLKYRIAKIRRENSLRTDAKKREIELKKSQELDRVQETRFTGVFSWVEMEGM